MNDTLKSRSLGRSIQGPDTGRRSPDGRRRFMVRIVIVAFGVATVTTSVFSLGAYCLTTDGGDFRQIQSSVPATQSATEAPNPVGPACALPSADGRDVDATAAASKVAETTGRSAGSRPPIDRVPPPDLKTATFALG
jgi:hypothetical protein